MGLDQYAYAAAKTINEGRSFAEQREIAYWRKHPNLQGWMQALWQRKGCPGSVTEVDQEYFNGVELELTWEDLDALEQDVLNGRLPPTSGFFFGTSSDDYYQKQDLEFIQQARAELFTGLKVFYNSSW